MKFGCALCLPTLEWVSSFSWSAASAPMNGTVKSLRKGGTRQPVTNLMSLEYSTACGFPWEPSCSKDVTFLPGQSAPFNPFAQCYISLGKSKYWGIRIICTLHCTQCFNYVTVDHLLHACGRLSGHTLCLGQFCLLSGWCALSGLIGIITALMFCSWKIQRKDGGTVWHNQLLLNACYRPSNVLSLHVYLSHWILTEA